MITKKVRTSHKIILHNQYASRASRANRITGLMCCISWQQPTPPDVTTHAP